MSNIEDALSALRRPRLLIKAARLGLDCYNRRSALRRLLPDGHVPTPSKALECLIKAEAEVNHERENGAASYSAMRHIELLAAMMAEARLLRDPSRA